MNESNLTTMSLVADNRDALCTIEMHCVKNCASFWWKIAKTDPPKTSLVSIQLILCCREVVECVVECLVECQTKFDINDKDI